MYEHEHGNSCCVSYKTSDQEAPRTPLQLRGADACTSVAWHRLMDSLQHAPLQHLNSTPVLSSVV